MKVNMNLLKKSMILCFLRLLLTKMAWSFNMRDVTGKFLLIFLL